MGRATGPRIAYPEILLIAVTSTATAATKTFAIFLNQVVFEFLFRGVRSRAVVIGIIGKPGRPIFRETDSCIRIAGDLVAIDFRRTVVADVDAPAVTGDQVVEDIRVGAVTDATAGRRSSNPWNGESHRARRRGARDPRCAAVQKGLRPPDWGLSE